MALHGHAFHVSLRTPGWLSAYVVKVFCGNGDVFSRLRHVVCNHQQEIAFPPSRRCFSARHVEFFEAAQIQLLKTSFGHRESESIVIEKRVDLDSRRLRER